MQVPTTVKDLHRADISLQLKKRLILCYIQFNFMYYGAQTWSLSKTPEARIKALKCSVIENYLESAIWTISRMRKFWKGWESKAAPALYATQQDFES